MLESLRDLYGPDFAAVLWDRYVKEFKLGKLGEEIVSPEALQAIGQVGSSARTDLSYGPRTVVSAFRQMVHTYQETSRTYQPENFVDDCLEDNIYVLPDYTSLVRQVLSSPEAGKEDTAAIKLLAAFPNGMPAEVASAFGLEKRVAQLARRGTIAYPSGKTYGLVALRQGGVVGAVDQLREAIADIVDGFSPNPRAFEAAADAFITHVIPLVFERRQGQQLLGWEYEEKWVPRPDKTKLIGLRGAFRQTEKDYPAREVAVAVGPQAVSTKAILPNTDPGEFPTDILFHFAIRWAEDEELPQQRIDISPGDPQGRVSGYVRLVLDFADESISWELREELQELLSQMRTPLAFLYLVQRMESVELPREHDAPWRAIRDQALRGLVLHLVDDATIKQQAREQAGRAITGAMPEFLGTVARLILGARYPDYHTLIRAPHWSEKVGDYIRVLKNQDIPFACKRGRQPWCVAGGAAAKAFGTSQMNLTGGAFDGFESLVEIASISRDETEIEFRIHPLEEAVKQAVTEDPKSATATIQGKECPYLSLHDLVPLFMGSGYQQEELQRIVEIGSTRGTFCKADLKGRPVIYCPPVDPEEMRAQLQEKLYELTAETEAFGNLPDYQSSIDLAALGREINEVQDEAQYDAINTRIAGAFEHNGARILGYVDRLADAVRRSRNEARDLRDALQKTSETATTKSSSKATSSWSAALSTHVAQGIRKAASGKQTGCANIVQKADKILSGLSSVEKAKSVKESVALLAAGFATARDLREDSERVRDEARLLQTYLDEHQEWLGLLSLSDSIYDSIVELKNDPSHAAKGAELLGELQKLWDEISDHLSTRGLLGIESHKQYRLKLQQLAEKRRTYVQRVKEQFDKEKDALNSLLRELGVTERCSEVFNPSDAEGSYSRLFDQAVECALETYQSEVEDLQTQRRELLYTRDILNRVEEDATAPVLGSLDEAKKGLDELLQAVSGEWIKATLGKPDGEKKKTGMVVEAARDASKKAKAVIRQAQPRAEKPGENADRMLRQIPEGRAVDLKDLVLHMMAHSEGSGEALDLSLSCLGELFRIGRIQVRAERINRR